MVCKHIFIKIRITDQTCLKYFTHSASKLYRWEGFQCIHVHIDKARLMKSSDHVFVLVKVHTCLAAYTAVHLREKCCRDLDKINASEIRRRSKSGKIAYHTAAKRNHKALAVKLVLNQCLVQLLHRIQVLVSLTCLKDKDRDSGCNLRKNTLYFLCIKRFHMGVCHNTEITSFQSLCTDRVCKSVKSLFKIDRIIKISISFYL